MAQAYIDSQVMEVIGKSTAYSMCEIDLMVMEVLGFFKFGNIEVDLIVGEVLGKTTSYAYIDHFDCEVIGQWSGF